ncbi:hypothetical protein P9112_014204 [Eukaryota sp. TZLM1-RC]
MQRSSSQEQRFTTEEQEYICKPVQKEETVCRPVQQTQPCQPCPQPCEPCAEEKPSKSHKVSSAYARKEEKKRIKEAHKSEARALKETHKLEKMDDNFYGSHKKAKESKQSGPCEPC